MIPRTPRNGGVTGGNLLEPFAWALFLVRRALNEAPSGRSPRWVRIARGRSLGGDGVGAIIGPAVRTLLDFIAAMHVLLLDFQDALVAIDAPKATIELLLEMAKAATAPELAAALSTLLEDPTILQSFADANSALQRPDAVLTLVPEPWDVDVIGRQLFEMLCVDPAPGRLSSSIGSTGRLRLLSWAYQLPISAPTRPLTGTARRVPVAALGVRARDLRSDDEPGVCAAIWRVPGGRDVELFKIDVRDGKDLDEVVDLLDALGYSSPAVERGQTRLTAPLTVRIRVFQHLNDLPLSGDLDADTVHRLLGLDRAQRTIARPRPFDPARWARIPAAPDRKQETITHPLIQGKPVPVTRHEDPLDHGDVPLVNPNADRYEDEGIALKQFTGKLRRGFDRALPYYIAGARVKEERAEFPAGVEGGWIQHMADDPYLLQERGSARPKVFGCCFVGLASRSMSDPPTRDGLLGGELSEGDAFGDSTFFFAAREVEPWLAGRHGTPDATHRLFKSPNWTGGVSGMYQWAPLGETFANTPSTKRLFVQASVQQRSLYKEDGAGRIPDQGRVIVGLARRGALEQLHGLRSRIREDLLSAWAWSDWWPNSLQRDLAASQTLYARGSNWKLIATPPLPVMSDCSHIFVGLYGKHNLNHDTDAYFADVRVRWWRAPVQTPAVAT